MYRDKTGYKNTINIFRLLVDISNAIGNFDISVPYGQWKKATIHKQNDSYT